MGQNFTPTTNHTQPPRDGISEVKAVDKSNPRDNPKERRKPGPKADKVKIEGDWERAMEKALKKKRPKDGWPKPESED